MQMISKMQYVEVVIHAHDKIFIIGIYAMNIYLF